MAGTETEMAGVLCCGRVSTCLRQKIRKKKYIYLCCVFFVCLTPFFARLLAFKTSVFLLLSFIVFSGCWFCRIFALFPPPFPPIYLLFMHCICNALMFCFCFVLFSARCIFLRQIVCYCFCRLCFLCFVAPLIQLVPCASAPFCSARFACSLIIGNISVVCFWLRFFCLCLRFFLLVCLASCFFAFSCCLPPVANIVARAPVGTQIHFSRAPHT